MALCYNMLSSRDYFMTPRRLAVDTALSLAARGLAVYLLSHPADTDFDVNDITRINGSLPEEIKSCLDELTTAGYIVDGVFTDKPVKAATANVELDHRPTFAERRPSTASTQQAPAPLPLPKRSKAARPTRNAALHKPNQDGGWAGPWPLGSTPCPPKGQAVVYVLFGRTDRAVYVGSTDNFLARMKAHEASGKRWSSWTAYPCSDREEAYEVEAEYLNEYMPHLNVQGPRHKKVVTE